MTDYILINIYVEGKTLDEWDDSDIPMHMLPKVIQDTKIKCSEEHRQSQIHICDWLCDTPCTRTRPEADLHVLAPIDALIKTIYLDEVVLELQPSYYNPYGPWDAVQAQREEMERKPVVMIRSRTFRDNLLEYLMDVGGCRVNKQIVDEHGPLITSINESCASYGP